MNHAPNQNEKVLEETIAGSNSDAVKVTYLKMTLFFSKLLKNLSSFLRHFVTLNREYCKQLCRLRRHIQIGLLLVPGTWLSLVTQSVT